MESMNLPRGSMPASRMSNSVGMDETSESSGDDLRRPSGWAVPSCSTDTSYFAPLPPWYFGTNRLILSPRTLSFGLPWRNPDPSTSDVWVSAFSGTFADPDALGPSFFPRKNSSKLISEMFLPAILSRPAVCLPCS